jgi:hypothetical protein
MSTIGAAVRDIMLTYTPLYGMVGEKIYPMKVAQNVVYPALSYQTVSTVPAECLGDTSKLDEVRIQISVFSRFYDQAFDIDQAVRGALDQYRGELKGYKLYISYVGSRDLYEEDAQIFHRSTDYKVIAHYL